MKTIHKMIPLAVVVTFAFGSNAVRADGLTEKQRNPIARHRKPVPSGG
jgi:hypothetical protein